MRPNDWPAGRVYTLLMSVEGDAASEPTVGSVELEETDLRPALIDMSALLRGRVAITLVLAACYVSIAAVAVDSWSSKVQMFIFPTFFLGILWVSPFLSARRLLRAIEKAGDRHAHFRFDDDGVTMRRAGATSTFTYRTLVEYREGRTAFLLYTSPNVANIVPKRAFTPEGLARVSALLAANVKPSKARGMNRMILLWIIAIFMFVVIWQFLNASGAPRA
jgi:hypothetical protein